MDIFPFATRLGLENCRPFDPALLVPEERVRDWCRRNDCGTYGRNYMCPPYAGTLADISKKLREYSKGWLVQLSVPLDVKKDRIALDRSKLDFHRKLLDLEKEMAAAGQTKIWGLIGGSCGLCVECNVLTGKPCAHPDDARSSLEANGLDVSKLLENVGLRLEFRDDLVTWTGCILTA